MGKTSTMQQTTLRWVLSVVCLCILAVGSVGGVASYVKAICDRNPIHTTALKSHGDHGFKIAFEGTPTQDKFQPGETYSVVVNGTEGRTMLGVIVTATVPGSNDSDSVGSFDVKRNGQVHDLQDERICEHHVISHRYLVEKDGVRFTWIAPKPASPVCILFRATVIQYSDVWFKDEGQLTKEICMELDLVEPSKVAVNESFEDLQPVSNVTQQDEAEAVSAGDSPGVEVGGGLGGGPGEDLLSQDPLEEDECCACGHAMYSVTFQGLWSRQTHPKQFPDSNFGYLLHWSNLVGSTHSNDYRVWRYDHYASDAVKEMCEYGAPRSLENEMKENSEKIRTVIKTKSLWGIQNLRGSVKAQYTVNKKKHLLSLLTMIGPSPDWCLGVSALSMCSSNCSWLDHKEVDLYPWDAGTDSGITYMAQNQPSNPREKIHRLTSSNPNHRDSPFYGQKIRPMGRLIITKTKEACTTDSGRSNSAENSPSTEELVSMMKMKMMMKKKLEMEKCATSQWTEWSSCSNPCGSGLSSRHRALKNAGILASMCSVDLQEKKGCVGDCKHQQQHHQHQPSRSSNRVEEPYNRHHHRHQGGAGGSRESRGPKEDLPEELCAVTGWSEWSGCSQTCGLGMKERWRMFISRSEKTVDCGIHLMEKDLCRGAIFDCRKAFMLKNFSAVCTLDSESGPCEGNFPRWFYNSSVQKCQVFSYGGCRGNDNRFDTEDECVQLCAEHMAEAQRQSADDQDDDDDDANGNKEKGRKKKHGNNKDKEAMADERLAALEQRTAEEKQRLLERQRLAQRRAMESKQRQMEADAQQKQLLLQKQQLAQLGDNMNLHQVKTAIAKVEGMLEQTEALELEPRAKLLMKREQRRMLRKLRRKHSRLLRARRNRHGGYGNGGIRSRRRRRQRHNKHHDDDDDGKNNNNNNNKNKNNNNGGARRARKRSPLDCQVSAWSPWTQCSVTCGKGAMTRTRAITRQAQPGGRRCPRRLIKTKKCKLSVKCPVDCKMGEWAEWSQCSESCGDRAVQIRRRRRVVKPKRGGLVCPSKRQTRFCSLPMCPDADVEKKINYYMMYHRRY